MKQSRCRRVVPCIGVMILAELAAACASNGASSRVVVTGPIQKEQFTRVHFSNAPESVDRVLSVRRSPEQVLLTVEVGACVGGSAPAGTTVLASRFVVSNAKNSGFRVGDFILTGVIWQDSRDIHVVRHLTRAESKACAARDPAAFVRSR